MGIGTHHIGEQGARRRGHSWRRTRRGVPGSGRPAAGSPHTHSCPAAISAATHGPRSVSIPITTSASSASAPSRCPISFVQPGTSPAATPSGSRLRASTCPRRPSTRRRDGPAPSHRPRTTASVLLCRPSSGIWPAALRRLNQRPNETVLTPSTRRARHPSSDQLSRPAGRGTICLQGSRRVPGEEQCSPAGGYQTRVCRVWRPGWGSARPLPVGGRRLLLGSRGQRVRCDRGGGRQIDRRPAPGCGSRLEGQAAPGVGAVSRRRRAGGGRPGGRRSA